MATGEAAGRRGAGTREPRGHHRRDAARRGGGLHGLPVCGAGAGAAALAGRLRRAADLCRACFPADPGGARLGALRAGGSPAMAGTFCRRGGTDDLRNRGGAGLGPGRHRRTGAAGRGRDRLPPVLLGQHALPHGDRRHPAGADGEHPRHPAARAAGGRGGPGGVLAAALSRHGPRGLPAGAPRRAGDGGLPLAAGIRAAAGSSGCG